MAEFTLAFMNDSETVECVGVHVSCKVVKSELEISTVYRLYIYVYTAEISLLLMYRVNSELEELSEAGSEAKEELRNACLILLWHIKLCMHM